MRLLDLRQCNLDSGKLTLIDTEGKQAPLYAILSHRWEAGEVIFSDIDRGTVAAKRGYEKVKGAIRQAVQDGHDYLWIDACCIDKSSSAELSEAINSMYRWYENARVCYAYLSDVMLNPPGRSTGHQSLWQDKDDSLDSDRRLFEEEFRASRWFTRGWTLQELVAPYDVRFYNNAWKLIGNKISLPSMISGITGIPTAILAGMEDPSGTSIARRMSWASERETSRVEDMAYCLMGLFSVHMPLLYGEGERAFIRLQEEIIRTSDDHSIFAWQERKGPKSFERMHGLLADAPAAFKHSGDSLPYRWPSQPFSMTNKGLRITLECLGSMAILPCAPSADRRELLAIYVVEMPGGAHQYARVNTSRLHSMSITRGQPRAMYFPQRAAEPNTTSIPFPHFRLCMGTPSQALPVELCFAEDYRGPSNAVYEATLFRNGADTSTALLHSLRSGMPSRELCVPTNDTELWIVILFKRQLVEPTKSSSFFVLLLGTQESGDLGYCVRPFNMANSNRQKYRRRRLPFDMQSLSIAYDHQAKATKEQFWQRRDFRKTFKPVSVGDTFVAELDVMSPASRLRRRSEAVLRSERVYVNLRERPMALTEQGRLVGMSGERALEILVSSSPLPMTNRIWPAGPSENGIEK